MRGENSVATKKVQLSLSENAVAVLVEVAKIGILGKTKTEVATRIVSDWIWNNQGNLAAQGISLRQPQITDKSTEEA